MTLPRFSYNDDQEAVKKFFDEQGYVIINNGFSVLEISDFKAELAANIRGFARKAGLEQNFEDIHSDGINALELVDHEYVASIYDAIFQGPAFFRMIGSKDIEGLTKRLLALPKDSALYGFTNRCRIDPPADDRRTYGWHQEVFYTVPRGHYLQTWAPLVYDATTENGSISICPGSHKEGIAAQTWNDIPGRATQILIADEVIAKYEPVQVEIAVGEVLFFNGHLAHKSGANRSEKVRFSLVGMYHDVGWKEFQTPKLSFAYRGESPREFYDNHFSQK